MGPVRAVCTEAGEGAPVSRDAQPAPHPFNAAASSIAPFGEALLATAGQPSVVGVAFSADALRRLHDGDRYFFDELRQQLFYRGPLPTPDVPLIVTPAPGCTCHTGIRKACCPVCSE